MNTQEKVTITEDEKEQFDYLNQLRRSGATNMFGAAPYLVEMFDLSKIEARKVLSNWMSNFNEDGYEHLLEDNDTES